MDFILPCPNCAQQLHCSAEHSGLTVNCPLCDTAFMVPPAPAAKPPLPRPSAGSQVKQWMVDVRVLVLRAPPAYFRIMVEVPRGWDLPKDAILPGPAQEAVATALREKFPQCPITPIKVYPADTAALKRVSDQAGFGNDSCRVWLLGKVSANA